MFFGRGHGHKAIDNAVATCQYVAYTYDAAGRRVSMFDTRLTTATVGGVLTANDLGLDPQ